ncbi:MAG TPA: sugar phosphate isomerase/epimerase family protein [Abditibacteriaceae bacterium]|jgi:sugar phosphate isomerase/epimerase
MKHEQLAINTISLRGALPEIITATAEAGFSNIEWYIGQIKSYVNEGHALAEVTALLQNAGLQSVGGFECGLEAFGSTESQAKNHAYIVENARLLAELGQGKQQCLVVGTDGAAIGELENPVERCAEVVGQVANQVAPLGVELLIEFNWGAVKSLPLAAEIARQSGASNAGVLFDPAHFHCTPTKFEDLTPENVAFIKHVHVNNMRRKAAELSNCNDDRLLPDDPTGALDVKALFTKIEANGYAGLFSIEMFSQELWDLPPATAAKRMFDSLQFLL